MAINSNKITEREIIALGRFSVGEVKAYSELLEVFLNTKIVSKKLIETLAKYCEMINDVIPYLRMYFSESLPYLRKARQTLILLTQRKKELELEYPQLTKLFVSNLDNINQFFNTFNLKVEELSNPPLSSDETQRKLYQRVINPLYDESKETKNLVTNITKSIENTRSETHPAMKTIADQLKEDYESNSFPVNQEVVEVSELFLQGVSNLYKRDSELKLAKDRATELSDLADAALTPRQRKIKQLLAQSSNNILRGC